MTTCPKCGKPARVKTVEVLGDRFRAARCKACKLVGVVGSAEPWISTDFTSAILQPLHDMAYRVEKARAVQQERYRDLETKG